MPMLHVLDSPTGIKVNRNESGLYASLLFAISLYGLIYKKFFNQFTNLSIVIVSLLTVALSFSKGTWVLALLATFIIIYLKYNPKIFFVTISIVLFLFLLIPFSDLLFIDAVLTRLSGSDKTNVVRFGYLMDAIFIGADNVFLGIGPGNYKEYTSSNGYLITVDPHNASAQSFAELGIGGLVLVLLLYIFNVYQSYFNLKKEEVFVIVFVLVVMLTADSFISGLSLTMKIFYILMALIMRGSLDVRKEK
jgi:O-antigen ligase